ncbi:MAG: MBL fold metallo-hydrolase [Acidobacteria bacterium]|nr:MBL fold metallo-hydrolase [Acidobacteriota bacterium]
MVPAFALLTFASCDSLKGLMRRAIVLFLFAALLVLALQTAGPGPGQVHQLAPDVYLRQADPDKRIIANAGWVVFRDYVLVIDANYPWGARAIVEDIRKTTNKPIRYVFDTHYHGDHAHGNSVFVDAGATIVCSAECAAESLRKNPPAWERSAAEYRDVRLEHPQIAFPDRMAFDDGAHRVELIKVGPGHTLGDSVAWLPKEGILFTGDLCVNRRSGNNVADADASPEGWVRALDGLMNFNPRTVVPGHGFLGGKEALAGQRAYLQAIIDGVRSGISRGQTADQLAETLDLGGHGLWGADKARNAPSIRAVYAKLKNR